MPIQGAPALVDNGFFTMDQTIAPTVGGALAFGWRHLKAMTTQNAGVFAILLMAGVALTVWAATPEHFQTASVESISGVVALGVIVRVFRPDFSMTAGTLLGIAGIYAWFAVIAVAAIGGPLFVALAFHAPALLLITLAELPIALWLIVKYSAAAPLYALRSKDDITIVDAFSEAGKRVSGEVWGRMFLAQLCTGIPLIVPAGLLSVIAFNALKSTSITMAALVAATFWYLGSIPTYAFNMAVTMAVAASADPRIEPAEAA